MQTIELVVLNKVGLHARPAAVFVKTASKFKSAITVCNLSAGEKTGNAKSILSVLSLGVQKDHRITVTADGADEAQAISALCEAVEARFGEAE